MSSSLSVWYPYLIVFYICFIWHRYSFDLYKTIEPKPMGQLFFHSGVISSETVLCENCSIHAELVSFFSFFSESLNQKKKPLEKQVGYTDICVPIHIKKLFLKTYTPGTKHRCLGYIYHSSLKRNDRALHSFAKCWFTLSSFDQPGVDLIG